MVAAAEREAARDAVPRGFKQTEIGLIPKDWEVSTLKDICNQITDGDHLTPRRESSGNFLLSARNIKDGIIDTQDVDFVGDAEFDRMARRCRPSPGDVLISCSGTIGRVALVPESLKCVLVRSAALLKARPLVCEANFLLYCLQSDVGQKQIEIRVNQGAQPNLFLNQIETMQIPLPPLAEQEAIAGALSDADGAIRAVDRALAKQRAVKQAALHALLTPTTRLPGFSGVWETKTLGQVFEVVNGLTYRPSDVVADGTIVLRSSNIQNETLAFDNNVFVRSDIAANSLVQRGDLLVCVRNGSRDLIGKVALIPEHSHSMAFGAFMAVLRGQGTEFLYHSFQNAEMKRQINERLGATINQITNASLKSFEISLPPLPEQCAIAAVLSDMDAAIAASEARRDKLKAVKQGMMQTLLTGKVRLV